MKNKRAPVQDSHGGPRGPCWHHVYGQMQLNPKVDRPVPLIAVPWTRIKTVRWTDSESARRKGSYTFHKVCCRIPRHFKAWADDTIYKGKLSDLCLKYFQLYRLNLKTDEWKTYSLKDQIIHIKCWLEMMSMFTAIIRSCTYTIFNPPHLTVYWFKCHCNVGKCAQ